MKVELLSLITFKFKVGPDPGNGERYIVRVFAGPDNHLQLAGELRLTHEEWRVFGIRFGLQPQVICRTFQSEAKVDEWTS